MRPNANLIKTTLTGALGGLLFGFDTVVIAGAIDALVKLYGLNPRDEGYTVAIGLVGTVIGALGAGWVGQKLGGRETLRITAVLYLVSALGCGLAWNWPSFLLFRFVGGLGIGASSVLGPVYIAELSPAAWRGRLVGVFQFNVVFGILVAYISNYMIHLLHLGAAGGHLLLVWRNDFAASMTSAPRLPRNTHRPTSRCFAGSTATPCFLPFPSAHSTSWPGSTRFSITSIASLRTPASAYCRAISMPSRLAQPTFCSPSPACR